MSKHYKPKDGEGEQSPEEHKKEIDAYIEANKYEHLKQHSPKSGKAVRK